MRVKNLNIKNEKDKANYFIIKSICTPTPQNISNQYDN